MVNGEADRKVVGHFGFDLGLDTWTPWVKADAETADVADSQVRDAASDRSGSAATATVPGGRPSVRWAVAGVIGLVVVGAVAWTLGGSSRDDAGGGASSSSVRGGSSACPSFSSGANLLGVPEVSDEPGVHVWHDVDGFHLRWVEGSGSPGALRGTILGEGTPLELVEPADGRGAAVNDGEITFDLGTGGGDVVFRAACSTSAVTFDLTDDGGRVAPSAVTVGRGTSPDAVPFTLTRGG